MRTINPTIATTITITTTFGSLETLARDHKCSGDVALTGAKGHDALGVNVRSAK